MVDKIPCISIDGMSGTGKSTIASGLAEKLNWNFLPSGCLYRWYAWQKDQGESLVGLAQRANQLDFKYTAAEGLKVLYYNQDITTFLINPAMSKKSSLLGKDFQVREALYEIQRAYLKKPGLVAEGRDMSSVVFKDATLKVYLIASLEVRAERRFKQLIDNGINATIPQLMSELKARDGQDMNRAAAPLKQVHDAYVVSTDTLSIDEVISTLANKVM